MARAYSEDLLLASQVDVYLTAKVLLRKGWGVRVPPLVYSEPGKLAEDYADTGDIIAWHPDGAGPFRCEVKRNHHPAVQGMTQATIWPWPWFTITSLHNYATKTAVDYWFIWSGEVLAVIKGETERRLGVERRLGNRIHPDDPQQTTARCIRPHQVDKWTNHKGEHLKGPNP